MKLLGKITSPLLGLTMLMFAILVTLSLRQMHAIKVEALKSNADIAERAIADSSAALIESSKDALKSLAQEQAMIIRLQLERTQAEVELTAIYAEQLLRRPIDSIEAAMALKDDPQPWNMLRQQEQLNEEALREQAKNMQSRRMKIDPKEDRKLRELLARQTQQFVPAVRLEELGALVVTNSAQIAVQKGKSAFLTEPGKQFVEIAPDLTKLSLIHESFSHMLDQDRNTDLIYIGTASGLFIEYPSRPIPADYNYKTREWYQRGMASADLFWTRPYFQLDFGTNQYYVATCAKQIVREDQQRIGVVAIDVNINTLFKFFIDQKTADGATFFIDKEGYVLVFEEAIRKFINDECLVMTEDKPAKSLFENEHADISAMAKQVLSGRADLLRVEVNGNAHYIACAPIGQFYLCIAMTEEDIIAATLKTKENIEQLRVVAEGNIDREISSSETKFVSFGTLDLLLISLLGIFIAKKLTRPIIQLDQVARTIGLGNFQQKIDIKTGDEVEGLATSLNQMSADLQQYVADLRDTTAAKERIECDLKIAKDIQSAMLPSTFPPFPHITEFEIFAAMDPAKEVGGDFYDFFFIDREKLFFLISDVSGKGVPAALFMAITKALLKNEAMQNIPLSEVLCKVNNTLEPDNDNSMFATVFCAILNTRTGRLEYCNAGHNPPLIYTASDDRYEYMRAANRRVLGPMPAEESTFKVETTIMNPGDMLLLYTDGVTEAMNVKREQFTSEKLEQLLNQWGRCSVIDVLKRIREEVQEFAGEEPQFDDITMLSLEFTGYHSASSAPVAAKEESVECNGSQKQAPLKRASARLGKRQHEIAAFH